MRCYVVLCGDACTLQLVCVFATVLWLLDVVVPWSAFHQQHSATTTIVAALQQQPYYHRFVINERRWSRNRRVSTTTRCANPIVVAQRCIYNVPFVTNRHIVVSSAINDDTVSGWTTNLSSNTDEGIDVPYDDDDGSKSLSTFLSAGRCTTTTLEAAEIDGQESAAQNTTTIVLQQRQLTSILLKVSYDGRHFTGWSAGNSSSDSIHGDESEQINKIKSDKGNVSTVAAYNSSRPVTRRRRRQLRQQSLDGVSSPPAAAPARNGFVRSVQSVIRHSIAKVCGNIDISRVVVEGSSRTDKGVYSTGMVCQIYVLKADHHLYDTTTVAAVAVDDHHKSSTTITSTAGTSTSDLENHQPSIPGKRLPHPWHGADASHFMPLPKPPQELATVLNRMMNPDIQVVAISSIPSVSMINSNSLTTTTVFGKRRPFHPSLSASSKTYRYCFSVGSLPDPTQWRYIWHIPLQDGTRNTWNATLANNACQLFLGQHDFAAFQASARGADDKRKRARQDTICSVFKCTIQANANSGWNKSATYVVEITGDRFLYKMVRLLVGSIVAVGCGRLSIQDVDQMLTAGHRKDAPEFQCAPAHGLVLHEVHYDETIDWQPVVKS